MGRPRKPLEQHQLDGTFRKDRHGPLPEDSTPAVPPAKPHSLVGPAGEFWDRVIVHLAGVVRERDADQLVEMCEWWATIQWLRPALRKAQPGSLRCSRLMAQISSAAAAFDRIAKRFGLTPADRATLREDAAAKPRAKVDTRPQTGIDREWSGKKGKKTKGKANGD
jgi:hypothetical protein